VEPFITHTGRALPLRHGSVGAEPILDLAPARRTGEGAAGPGDDVSPYSGATILISGPDSGISQAREQAARALAGCGFRAVISSRFSDFFHNEMIQVGIVLARLPDNAVDKLLHAVEADPRIPITIDLARREVTAHGGPCAVFEIAEYARQRLMAGTDALADRLMAAQRSLASCDLAADLRVRLQRRLTAICDAMKAPDADLDRGKRRLEKFLEELEHRR
jgi:3-isopropylmalate/(R)-2-methylmalate dehydratase small subunit